MRPRTTIVLAALSISIAAGGFAGGISRSGRAVAHTYSGVCATVIASGGYCEEYKSVSLPAPDPTLGDTYQVLVSVSLCEPAQLNNSVEVELFLAGGLWGWGVATKGMSGYYEYVSNCIDPSGAGFPDEVRVSGVAGYGVPICCAAALIRPCEPGWEYCVPDMDLCPEECTSCEGWASIASPRPNCEGTGGQQQLATGSLCGAFCEEGNIECPSEQYKVEIVLEICGITTEGNTPSLRLAQPSVALCAGGAGNYGQCGVVPLSSYVTTPIEKVGTSTDPDTGATTEIWRVRSSECGILPEPFPFCCYVFDSEDSSRVLLDIEYKVLCCECPFE